MVVRKEKGRPKGREHIEQIAFKTPAPALTAQVNCAYAYAAASHADAWLAEHFQKQNALNGIEGFWSYAKNWLYPFRGVPKKFFHLYLAEACFRFNHRKEDIYPIFFKALKTMPVE